MDLDLDRANEILRQSLEAIERIKDENVENAVNGRLADAYRNAYKAIEAELAKLYASSNGDLAEARKYKRLETMQSAIASEYTRLTRQAISITGQTAAEAYATGAMGSRWAMDEATGVDIRYPLLPLNAIRESVREEVAGEDYRTRLKYYEEEQRTAIQRHVVQGLATGAGYQKTARKLRDDLDISYADAVRIVRTESTRDYTNGKLQTHDDLQKLGIETRMQWSSAHDARVREDHLALDGELSDDNGEWNLAGEMVKGPGLSSDPAQSCNCRCAIYDVIEGYEPEKLERYSDGTFSSESYTEWAESQGWSAKDGWPKAREATK